MTDIFDIRGKIERFVRLEETERDEEDEAEFIALRELLDDVRDNGGDHQWRGDWYPVTFIADSDFEEYARDCADDIGATNPRADWPLNCIDWERAARELQEDYSSVEYDGTTYWYR